MQSFDSFLRNLLWQRRVSSWFLSMSDASRASVVHRKAAAESVLDIQDDKAPRPRAPSSRKNVFAYIGLLLVLVILVINFSKIQSTFGSRLQKQQQQESLPLHGDVSDSGSAATAGFLTTSFTDASSSSRVEELQARLDQIDKKLREASAGKLSQQTGSLAEQRHDAPSPRPPTKTFSPVSQSQRGSDSLSQHAAAPDVHSHLLEFIGSLNAAGRNLRSDCDDPDFKDADLVNSFHSKKVDICTPTSTLDEPGAAKISGSHVVCYQHQQARHTATDSICEGRNVALHLPSVTGSAMTGFVEATWMSMQQGALVAACNPIGPFTKDKFPLCLGDWFVSGFRQVTTRRAPGCACLMLQ